MHTFIKRLSIVCLTIFCLSIGGTFIPNNIFTGQGTTAYAKAVYFKYGKVWPWTSKVTSLGKQPIHKTKNKKYKATVYRVYVSKNDIKNKKATFLASIGIVGGKIPGAITTIIGVNLNAPKKGLQYNLQMVNSKVTYAWNYKAWNN